MKKLIIVLGLLLMSPLAYANGSIVQISRPTEKPQFIEAPLAINWTIDRKDANRAIYIYLDEKESGKGWLIGVGRNETPNYTWQPTNAFFERIGLNPLSHEFRIRLSTRLDYRWVRGRGEYFTFTDQPQNSTKETEKGGETANEADDTINTVPKAPATISLSDSGYSLASRYKFNALYEDWEVRRVTVVTDTENDGFEPDVNESISSLNKIFIQYKDLNGNTIQQSGNPVNSQTTFSNMKLHIARGESSNLELWIKIDESADIRPEESGKVFKVGLQDQDNSESTFEAMGLVSSTRETKLANINSSASDIKEFVVRKANSFIEMNTATDQVLSVGENEIKFTVSPFQGQMITLARLVFEVNQNNVNQLDQINFFRNGQRLKPSSTSQNGQVNLMWDAGGTSCFADTLQLGANTGMNCNGNTSSTAKLIVTFVNEEIISEITQYKLQFSAFGINNNAYVSVNLADGDENSIPNLGGSIPSTGSLHNNLGVSELFLNATDFASEASSITDRNFIWSDRSALNSHEYPTFIPGALPSISTNSSADYTNGHYLKIDQLPSVNFRN